jgi:hypothetical protein
MTWVHGAGTPVGIVAEMLAAGLNANLGGRNHAPIEIERNAGVVLPAPVCLELRQDPSRIPAFGCGDLISSPTS